MRGFSQRKRTCCRASMWSMGARRGRTGDGPTFSTIIQITQKVIIDGMEWGHLLPPTALGREARMPKQIANASPGFLGQPSSKWQDPVALVRRRLSRSRMQDVGEGGLHAAGGEQLRVHVLAAAASSASLATAFTLQSPPKQSARKRSTVI